MKDFYSHSFDSLTVLQTPNLWETYQSYNYILAKNGKAVILDPGDYQPIKKTLTTNHLTLEKIILTHHHKDHVGAVEKFKRGTGCEVWGFKKDRFRLPGVTHFFQAEETLVMLGEFFQIMHCPGHTLGLCVLYTPQKKLLFANDLLFSLGCGRVFEGTMLQMFQSLKKISRLPDETLIFCSHEYTRSNLEFALKTFPNDIPIGLIEKDIMEKINQEIPTVPTSLGFEKRHNPFLRCQEPSIKSSLAMKEASESEVFAEIRRRKDNF